MTEHQSKEEEEWDLVEEISRDKPSNHEKHSDNQSNSDPITTEDNLSDGFEEQYEDGDYIEDEDVAVPSHPVIAPTALGLKFSYRDAVLKNKHPGTANELPSSSSSSTNVKRQRTTWKPVFKVEKVVAPKPVDTSSYYCPNPEGIT